MKNKNTLITIILLFCIVLIILLLVVIFSLLKMFNINTDRVKESKTIIEKKYSLDKIDTITFDFKRSNVVIKSSNTEELIITQKTKEERFYLNEGNTSNTINFEEDSYIFDGKNKKYTIQIPKDYIGNLYITNGFGEISLLNIKNSFYIDNNSGGVNLYKCDNVKVKDVSGDLNIDGVTGDTTISSSTGNITISNATGTMKVDTLTGDIIVNNFKIEGNSEIENISGNIIMTINRESECKINANNESGSLNINKKICKDKKNILEVKNVTGNININ